MQFMFKSLTRLSSLALAVGMTVALSVTAVPALAEEGGLKPARLSWTFWGPFGYYDKAQLQRGFKVYREVCANCHSLKLVAFRNLADKGGPEFSEAQVKALAAEYKVMGEPNDKGDVEQRPARPADHFPLIFPNDQAAAASNGGGIPPDMSLLAKARAVKSGFPWFVVDVFTQYQEAGPDYMHALISEGYLADPEKDKPPEGITVPEGKSYNKYFPGHIISMPKPLADKQVEYTDGSPMTVDQYSRDVAAFLMWAAEPGLTERKETGFKVILFLIVLSGLLYFTKKKVWAGEAH